jgi:t-SNARE complex subunit (syntaxin)
MPRRSLAQAPGFAVKNALLEIQEKHRDIMRLEASVREMQQLFFDMAMLVEEQGQLLDHIENSVEQTLAYTERGNDELLKAKEYQKKARKVCAATLLTASHARRRCFASFAASSSSS